MEMALESLRNARHKGSANELVGKSESNIVSKTDITGHRQPTRLGARNGEGNSRINVASSMEACGRRVNTSEYV